MRYIFIILMNIFLVGCITIHTTNFDNHTIEEIRDTVEHNKKIDISFSVIAVGEFLPELSDVAQRIKNEITSYNIFRKVLYTDDKNKTEYHILFKFYIRNVETGQSFGEIMTRLLSGLTLYLLPATQDCYIDATVYLFKKGKMIYSLSAPQKFVRLFWLPSLLTYPYYNHFIMRQHVFEKSVKYFMFELLNNKLL